MAIVSYPLNNIGYSAEDVAIYNSTRTSGVYAGDDFTATATGSDNYVTVNPGLAWMHISRFVGIAVSSQTAEVVDLGLPPANFPRIDAIVLQFNANANATQLVVKRGAEASEPVPPERSTSEALYELHLYHVRREPGTSSVSTMDLTDKRNDSEYCGRMVDSVTEIDTGDLQAKYTVALEEMRRAIAEAWEGEIPDGAVSVVLSATIGTNWAGSDPYRQTVSVPGLLSTDSPIVDIVPTDNYSIAEAQLDAYGNFYRMVAGDNQLTVYATGATDVSVPVQLRCIRK